MSTNQIAVFVKPWKELSLKELGEKLQKIGFAWIELPVRPGFACQPDTIEVDLPEAARVLGDYGVGILNVSADLDLNDERLYAACARAGVDLNRVMFRRGKRNYWEAEADARRQLDEALPLCQKYNIRIGVQNHVGDFVGVNALSLYSLLKDYDVKYIGAIWDAAHEALAGMEPEPALDIVDGLLHIVNLKNSFWRRTNGPEAEVAEWETYWTSGRQGRANWPKVIAKIKEMKYPGPICLTAEYSDQSSVDRLIQKDLAYAQALLAS